MPKKESGTKNCDNLEAPDAANDPGEAENDCPDNEDWDDVADERRLGNPLHLGIRRPRSVSGVR